MREPDSLPPDAAPAILAALAELCPFGVAVAVPPHGAVVMQNRAAAELLALFGAEPGGGPIARCLAGEVIAGEALRRVRPDGRIADLHVRATPVRDASGAVVAAVTTVEDATDARRRALARSLLDDAGRVLSESLEVEPILHTAAELAVPRLGDWCVVATVEGDDRLHVRAVAHVDPHTTAGAREHADARPFPLEARVWEVIHSGLPALDATLADDLVAAGDPEHAGWLRSLGLRSAMSLPLIARGRALGAVRLFTADSGRTYDADDLDLARRYCDRIALALDNARLYEEAQRAGQAREDMLTLVSHDLRNPLSAITLGTNVLMRKIRDAEENVGVIQRSAGRIERIVENLLDLASTQAGQPVAMEREVADAGDLVREAVLLQQPLADKKGVRVVTDVQFADAPLFCDRTRILQVFGNLLDNAIKFSSSGQEVTVRGDVADRHVRFAVSDRGPGLRESDLPHIFEPFWSAPRGGKKGLGLGLSIAKSIVDAHDGRMWVSSDPSQGTTFYFTLPLAH